MHIFGEIPFIKPQTTLKQQVNEKTNKQKTMTNKEKTSLVLAKFVQLVQCL